MNKYAEELGRYKALRDAGVIRNNLMTKEAGKLDLLKGIGSKAMKWMGGQKDKFVGGARSVSEGAKNYRNLVKNYNQSGNMVSNMRSIYRNSGQPGRAQMYANAAKPMGTQMASGLRAMSPGLTAGGIGTAGLGYAAFGGSPQAQAPAPRQQQAWVEKYIPQNMQSQIPDQYRYVK